MANRGFLLSVTTASILMLVAFSGCKSAKFELGSLEIVPNEVTIGETATISADVENLGTADGIYIAEFSLDGVTLVTEETVIPSGSTRTVSFTLVGEERGAHAVSIGNLSGQLRVLQPATFEVGSLLLTSDEVVLGQEVAVGVDVSNTGDLEGDYTCVLLLNGAESQRKELTLAGGATERVGFALEPSEAGPYQVAIADSTRTIRVLRPAEFSLSSLTILPEQVAAGSSVDISVIAANTGEAKGSHQVTLKLDGVVVASEDVALAGGEATSVSFALVRDTAGIYEVEVNALGGTIRVVPVSPPGYRGYADWANGFFLSYPENWEVIPVENGTVWGDLVYFAGLPDPIRPSVLVHRRVFDYRQTVNSFAEAGIEEIKSWFPGYRLMSTEELTIDDNPAIKQVFEVPVSGGPVSKIVRMRVYVVREMMGFLFRCDFSVEKFPLIEPTFDTVVGSFRYLP